MATVMRKMNAAIVGSEGETLMAAKNLFGRKCG